MLHKQTRIQKYKNKWGNEKDIWKLQKELQNLILLKNGFWSGRNENINYNYNNLKMEWIINVIAYLNIEKRK